MFRRQRSYPVVAADVIKKAAIFLEPFWNILKNEFAPEWDAATRWQVEIMQRNDCERHPSSLRQTRLTPLVP